MGRPGRPRARLLAVALCVALVAPACFGGDGDRATGVLRSGTGSYGGYTLFAPNTLTTTYLVDQRGRVVHRWESDTVPGLSVRLLEDGDLLRAARAPDTGQFNHGGRGGRVERFTWDGALEWRLDYAGPRHLQHHDVEILPNGNVLLIVWEAKTPAEAIAVGRDAATVRAGVLWPDAIVEVEPTTGRVVWEWHVWDHLVLDRSPAKPSYGRPADHPGRVDINHFSDPANPDWMHSNSVDHDPVTDRILLSVRQFDEVWVIDHGTTTEEARGPAGDLLYRWGNPAAYGRGTAADRQLSRQHDAQWVPVGYPGAGNITVFDNGVARGSSSARELAPVRQGEGYATDAAGRYLPATSEPIFPQRRADRFFASVVSGVQRLPNGNSLVTDGTAGRVVEVSPAGRVVWEYVSPYSDGRDEHRDGVERTRFFRAQRYGTEHPAIRAHLDAR